MKNEKFMGYDTLESFKEAFVMFNKQELALKDNKSYFDVKTSNMDGTIVGETFDNKIRLKALKDNNKEFYSQINETELLLQAKKEYLEDLEKVKE